MGRTDRVVGVNLHGVHNGTKVFLPHLLDSGDGYVVNISSIEGLISMPWVSSYCMTKYGVRGLTETLRQEARALRWPIGVSSVHPGFIRTSIADSFPEVTESLHTLFKRLCFTDADKAARIIVKGVERRKARILVGPDAYIYGAIPRVLGSRYSDAFGVIGQLSLPAARKRGLPV